MFLATIPFWKPPIGGINFVYVVYKNVQLCKFCNFLCDFKDHCVFLKIGILKYTFSSNQKSWKLSFFIVVKVTHHLLLKSEFAIYKILKIG